MKNVNEIIGEVGEIYRQSGDEAQEYLDKARKLKMVLGAGTAIIYCWFYSVPQKWTQVEPKIFELMKHTNSFDLDTVIIMPQERLAILLRPMIFYNQVSLQLKNFCRVIKDKYVTWESFAKALEKEQVFTLFETLKRHKNIRLTFKNLAAMKIVVGMDDCLLILDTHVANVIGVDGKEASKFRTKEASFKLLLDMANKVTDELKKMGFSDLSTSSWSLAIWFNKAGISAGELLRDNIIY